MSPTSRYCTNFVKINGYRHGRNDFAEGSKILLDLKIILLEIKIMSKIIAKNVDILATNSSVLHNYFGSSTKLLFSSVSSQNFKSFSKTVLSVRRISEKRDS